MQELGDQSAAVRERAQIVHLREIAARDLKPHRAAPVARRSAP